MATVPVELTVQSNYWTAVSIAPVSQGQCRVSYFSYNIAVGRPLNQVKDKAWIWKLWCDINIKPMMWYKYKANQNLVYVQMCCKRYFTNISIFHVWIPVWGLFLVTFYLLWFLYNEEEQDCSCIISAGRMFQVWPVISS